MANDLGDGCFFNHALQFLIISFWGAATFNVYVAVLREETLNPNFFLLLLQKHLTIVCDRVNVKFKVNLDLFKCLTNGL